MDLKVEVVSDVPVATSDGFSGVQTSRCVLVSMPTLQTATPNFAGGVPWMTMHLKLLVQMSKPSTTLYVETPYNSPRPKLSGSARLLFS